MDLMKQFMRAARPAERENATGRRAPEAPDALSLLHEDHENVKRLFAEALSDGTSAANRTKLAAKIADELTLHAQVEERYLYPAVKAASKRNSEEREEVLEAVEEHAAVKNAVKRLQALEARDETQQAKLQVLKELVEHHVADEESKLFPETRSLLGRDELREIGAKIAAAKEGKSVPAPRPRAATKRSGRKKSAA